MPVDCRRMLRGGSGRGECPYALPEMVDAQCSGELLWGWSGMRPGWKRGWRSQCGLQKRVKEAPEAIMHMLDVCVPMSTLTFE